MFYKEQIRMFYKEQIRMLNFFLFVCVFLFFFEVTHIKVTHMENRWYKRYLFVVQESF